MIRYLLLIISYLSLLSFCYAQETITPEIRFKNIEIGGRSMPIQHIYSIDRFYDIAKFEYVAKPHNLNTVYHYRLTENILGNIREVEWKETTDTTLRVDLQESKNYVFQIYAVVPKVGKTPTQEVRIITANPWWRSWWFWAACFISLFGLFYGRERFLKFWADEERRHTKQVSELELRTLQLQMNPHFIFNTLNAVQSFVISNDIISANNYLSKFASLIRMFLDSSRSKYISLAEEVKLLNLYVEMEALRFDNKFDYSIKMLTGVNKYFEIPTMIIQPFVENAINHGLRNKEGKGHLDVTFRDDGRNVVCEIEDNGIGRKRAEEIKKRNKNRHKSQGLEITAERVQVFNLMANVEIEYSIEDKNPAEQDAGTVVRIKFPKFK